MICDRSPLPVGRNSYSGRARRWFPGKHVHFIVVRCTFVAVHGSVRPKSCAACMVHVEDVLRLNF